MAVRRPVKFKDIKSARLVEGPLVVGRNVRELRRALGWSQEFLAEKTDLHWTYISSIERGKRNVGVKNICALAAALGKHPRDLFSE